MTPLRADVLPRAAVTAPMREQMFHLLSAHFDGVERALFDADLDEKDEVITLSDADGALRGFSTLRAWRLELDGQALWALFSGDTIVDQAAWGSPALARGWLEAALRLRERAGGEPVYWMLICSGFRTYRFLPVFFHQFFPRHDAPTPPETKPPEKKDDSQPALPTEGYEHVVAAGESIGAILQAYNQKYQLKVKTADVLRANPKLKDPKKIFVGQKLWIPEIK